jgi:excinuclease ABC subunit A
MGPEGGSRGGTVVAEGTPEEIAAVAESHTGHFLRPLLDGRGAQQPGAPKRAPKAATDAKGPAAKKAAAKKTATRKAAAVKKATTGTATRKRKA